MLPQHGGGKMFSYAEEIARIDDLFRYDHLPGHLQEISKPFHRLARRLADEAAAGQSGADSDLHVALYAEMLRMLWDVKNRAVWLAVERKRQVDALKPAVAE